VATESFTRRGSLWVVGTGITLISQTTLEAVACMRSAEKLFYVVADSATELWIRSINNTAATLRDCYAEGKRRDKTYEEMTERILAAVRQGLRVCAAFYGHPGVFVRPSHDAIGQARAEGFHAKMLPGISSEDCLFADLGVDPGRSGCQSFEATDFMIHKRRFDPSSGLILWQVGALGESGFYSEMTCRPERLRFLTQRLRRSYHGDHNVILYEAAQFSICEPFVKGIALKNLPAETVTATTTLYVPPNPTAIEDPAVSRWVSES
jgi:uncharacterized protein YabN with tetrapyrrole methylase and pyrophosphatase domain